MPRLSRFSGVQLEVMRAMYLAGQKLSQIGDRFGCSAGNVAHHLENMGVPRRKFEKHTNEAKQKMSAAKIGRAQSEETKRKRGVYKLGPKHSVDSRRKMSAIAKLRGENHNWYRDGKGQERDTTRRKEMNRFEYRIWRKAVFERDNYTCQECGQRGGSLNADHIEPWASNELLRYCVSNGRTLCVNCHRKTPTYGKRSKTAEVVNPFGND